MALFAINVAKLSFSHRSFQYFMVTRSPNHWCAISWAMTDAILFFEAFPELSLCSKADSLNVIAPQFSIAPAANSGTDMRCIFGSMYGIPVYSLKKSIHCSATSSGNFVVSMCPFNPVR